MLPKKKRLTTAEFDAVMEKGRVSHSSLFLVRWSSNNKDTRFSAVVAQKVVKTAVGRNALRRRMYSIIEKIEGRAASGIHAAVFAKSPAITSDHKALHADMEALFVKAGLLR